MGYTTQREFSSWHDSESMSSKQTFHGFSHIRDRFLSPFLCPPSSEWAPGVKLGITYGENLNWLPYFTTRWKRIAPL